MIAVRWTEIFNRKWRSALDILGLERSQVFGLGSKSGQRAMFIELIIASGILV